MRWRWLLVGRLFASASLLEDADNEDLLVEKDHLRCISGKSESFLNKLCGSALDGSDAIV